jgi:hypothetical protein
MNETELKVEADEEKVSEGNMLVKNNEENSKQNDENSE